MFKLLTPAVLSSLLLSPSLFANDYNAYNDNNFEYNYSDYVVKEYESETPGNLYEIKLGAGFAHAGKNSSSMPLISVGKRFEVGDAALEISTGWGKHKTDSGYKTQYFSFPKLTYLAFVQPNSRASFYYGGGFSWSSVEHSSSNYSTDRTYFRGIFAEGTVGYELHRTTAIRTMIELSLSQPLVANSKKGGHPGPTGFLSLSFGF